MPTSTGRQTAIERDGPLVNAYAGTIRLKRMKVRVVITGDTCRNRHLLPSPLKNPA